MRQHLRNPGGFRVNEGDFRFIIEPAYDRD